MIYPEPGDYLKNLQGLWVLDYPRLWTDVPLNSGIIVQNRIHSCSLPSYILYRRTFYCSAEYLSLAALFFLFALSLGDDKSRRWTRKV